MDDITPGMPENSISYYIYAAYAQIGKAVFSNLFMGYKGMGTDVHAALGCNLFRMIAGTKKWWLFPPSQAPYVFASLNSNGFVAYTKVYMYKYMDACN